jgi:hypothetical protein
MMLIGLLAVGFMIIERSRPVYAPLGYVGASIRDMGVSKKEDVPEGAHPL